MDQPLLGRCKDCDYALFVAPEQIEGMREVRELRDIKQSGVPYYVGNTILARCDKGHRVFSLRRIEGTYSPDHKCDERCLKAKGWKCRCSCGGEPIWRTRNKKSDILARSDGISLATSS